MLYPCLPKKKDIYGSIAYQKG